MDPLIQLKATTSLFFITLVLACIELSPSARAVVPAPDGGYPNFNTAEGKTALFSLTSGAANTAVGWLSLRALTTGQFNTGVGAGTLALNTADQNTATGAGALLSNTTGSQNAANGAFALFGNTEGNFNTANGVQALFSNTTGDQNTANGNGALFSNTTGQRNTANGVGALLSNTSGNFNTASGREALHDNTMGGGNTAVGNLALAHNTTGSGNIALGEGAGFDVQTANNVISIGHAGANVDNSCYIGQVFGATSSGGAAVFINSDGKLGTATSSRRFKEEIKPMERVSEALFALKPVTFRYKKEIDSAGVSQFGLVAEDVDKVNRDLVVRDEEGKPYSVRYDQVNGMLLNEFLKEHRKVEEQDRKLEQQEASLAKQQKQIEALTAGLQKVSAKLAAASPSRGGLEATKFATGRIRRGGPAPQVVNNP